MNNLNIIEDVKYSVTNLISRVFSCFKVGKLLFVNFEITYDTILDDGDILLTFDNSIKIKNNLHTISCTVTEPYQFSYLRITGNKNKILLDSVHMKDGYKSGHSYVKEIFVLE